MRNGAGWVGCLDKADEASTCIVCGRMFHGAAKCCGAECEALYKQANRSQSFLDPRGGNRPVLIETLYDVIRWRKRRPDMTLDDIAELLKRDPGAFRVQLDEAERNGMMDRARLVLGGRI